MPHGGLQLAAEEMGCLEGLENLHIPANDVLAPIPHEILEEDLDTHLQFASLLQVSRPSKGPGIHCGVAAVAGSFCSALMSMLCLHLACMGQAGMLSTAGLGLMSENAAGFLSKSPAVQHLASGGMNAELQPSDLNPPPSDREPQPPSSTSGP